MQKFLTLALAFLVLLLAAVCFWQASELTTQKTNLATTQAELKKQTERSETQKLLIKKLEEEKTEMAAAPSTTENSTAAKQEKNGGAAADDSAAGDEKGGLGGMMAKMMKDPEMKKALAAQQGLMIKKMYSPLLKNMNLSPEETEKFNTLLADHQLANMEAGSALMGGDGDKAEATKKIQEVSKEFESSMKQFLGDDRYGQYTNYQQSLADRMAVDQFKGELGDHPLTEEQSQQLLQLMIAERKNAGAFAPDGAEGLSLLNSDEALSKLMDKATEADRQILAKATFLSSEQIQALGEFQTNQMAMQKMGIEMAKKFMGTNKTANPAVFGAPASP